MILEASNHRNTGDIRAVWQYYIEDTHSKVTSDPENATQRPYEAIVNIVREMSNRLNNSELTFSPSLLIPMIETYAFEFQTGVGPQNWVVDLFISVAFPFDAILVALHEIYSGEVSPFSGTNKRVIADHIIYACEQWYQDCIKSNKRLFGSEENAIELTQILHDLSQSGLPQDKVQRANNLIRKVQQSYL
jgi:nuclear pore complex protein Nup155